MKDYFPGNYRRHRFSLRPCREFRRGVYFQPRYGNFTALGLWFYFHYGGLLFLYAALNIIEPTYVQICYTLDPAVACILGLVVFGQTLTFGQVVGIVIIFITVIWLQVEPKRLKPPTDTNASAKQMPQ